MVVDFIFFFFLTPWIWQWTANNWFYVISIFSLCKYTFLILLNRKKYWHTDLHPTYSLPTFHKELSTSNLTVQWNSGLWLKIGENPPTIPKHSTQQKTHHKPTQNTQSTHTPIKKHIPSQKKPHSNSNVKCLLNLWLRVDYVTYAKNIIQPTECPMSSVEI